MTKVMLGQCLSSPLFRFESSSQHVASSLRLGSSVIVRKWKLRQTIKT